MTFTASLVKLSGATYRPEVFAATSQLLSDLAESARFVGACRTMSRPMPRASPRPDRRSRRVGRKAAEPARRSFQEELASQSSRGQLRVIDDSGHLTANERPEAVVPAVEDVLEMAAQ